jgi:hypothetical protein
VPTCQPARHWRGNRIGAAPWSIAGAQPRSSSPARCESEAGGGGDGCGLELERQENGEERGVEECSRPLVSERRLFSGLPPGLGLTLRSRPPV